MAHSFKDNAGREWQLHVSVQTCRRVKEATGVDLGTICNDTLGPLEALLSDPPRLVDVVWVMCKDQAEKVGVTDEQLGEALCGDSLGAASDALIGAVVDFLPNRKRREAVTAVIEKGKAYRDASASVLIERLGGVDPAEIARKMAEGVPAVASPVANDLPADVGR